MENAPQSFLKRFRTHIFIVLGILVVGGSVSAFVINENRKNDAKELLSATEEAVDPYDAFLGEIYDTVIASYWEEITDEQLSELFRLGVNKISEKENTLLSKDRAGALGLAKLHLDGKSEEQKVDDTAKLGAIVLANLQPFGRSQLLTQEVKQQLIDTVSNIDNKNDLYAKLDIPKNALADEVENAYKKKLAELEVKSKTSEEAKKQLEEVEYARNVLKDENAKAQYDKNGARPTTYTTLLSGNVAYVRFEKFSPQLLNELAQAAQELGEYKNSDSLIIDIRGNIGGYIETLQYFLGPFIGPNQYAYDFYRKGEPISNKTKTTFLPEIQKYKKVVLLIDENVQSSAEVLTATFKRFNVGVVVGTKTKGWGTIEHLIPMKNQISDKTEYSIMIVEDITLREDQQPIEGRGVEPDIDITSKSWKKELLSYYNNPELLSAVDRAWNNPPAYE